MIGIGLLFLGLIWSVLLLAVQGEISIETADLTGFRLWLITSDEQSGLGLSRTRSLPAEPDENREHCVETVTQFLLFRSSAPQAPHSYCECYQDQGDRWQYVGACER